jgi:ornithine carbamoyltransferase
MLPNLSPPSSAHAEDLPRPVIEALQAHAGRLQRAARAGHAERPLRGKNLGLIRAPGPAQDATAASLFRQAATELGAQVAELQPGLSETSTPEEIAYTARLLGRLYDALVCHGLPATLVRQMGLHAGVPVVDGMAAMHHPSARLAALLEGDASLSDKRRFLLQALILANLV